MQQSRFRLPQVAYQKSGQVQAAPPPPKVTKIKTPLAERLSLSVYASPDWSKLDVRRVEPDAFQYGDEVLQTGILAGIRVGLKLGVAGRGRIQRFQLRRRNAPPDTDGGKRKRTN